MEHIGTLTLETERLVLRQFAPEDAEAMFRNLFSDAAAMRFLPWTIHLTVSESQSLLAHYIDGYARTDCYAWI